MKLNWGHKLTIGMVSFMVFIVLLVTSMMRQKVDLVEKNYYERGIKYEQEIKSKEGASALIHISNDKDAVYLKTTGSKKITGVISFYRPSDEGKDFEVKFETNGQELYQVPLSGVEKGLWNIRVKWIDEEGEHLLEQVLVL